MQTVVTARDSLGASSKDIVPKFECKSLKGLQQATIPLVSRQKCGRLTITCRICFEHLLRKDYFALAAALIKESPLGTPHPVTLSQPGVTVREVSVPKLMSTYSPPRFQKAL